MADPKLVKVGDTIEVMVHRIDLDSHLARQVLVLVLDLFRHLLVGRVSSRVVSGHSVIGLGDGLGERGVDSELAVVGVGTSDASVSSEGLGVPFEPGVRTKVGRGDGSRLRTAVESDDSIIPIASMDCVEIGDTLLLVPAPGIHSLVSAPPWGRPGLRPKRRGECPGRARRRSLDRCPW